MCWPLGKLCPKTGESFETLKNHSHIYNCLNNLLLSRNYSSVDYQPWRGIHLLQLTLSMKDNMKIQQFPVELNHSNVLSSLHKQNISLFYHHITQLLYKRSQKYYPINKIIPKLIKLLNIYKNRFNKLKHTQIRITQMLMINILPIYQIILLPNIFSQFQVRTKIIMTKNQRHKHGKPVNISHHLHCNLETESDRKYGGTTDGSTKHHVYNYNLKHFDQIFIIPTKYPLSLKCHKVCFGHHSKIWKYHFWNEKQ